MSRPQKKSAPLTKKITIRMTENDYQTYLSELLKNGIDPTTRSSYTASDYIRDLICNRIPPTVIKSKTRSVPQPSECDKERIRMLSNTTNNINQLAKSANIALNSKDEEALLDVLKNLNFLAEYVKGELL